MPIELIATIPGDGWAYFREGEGAKLVTPPYRPEDVLTIDRTVLLSVLGRPGVERPPLEARKFKTFANLRQHLKSQSRHDLLRILGSAEIPETLPLSYLHPREVENLATLVKNSDLSPREQAQAAASLNEASSLARERETIRKSLKPARTPTSPKSSRVIILSPDRISRDDDVSDRIERLEKLSSG